MRIAPPLHYCCTLPRSQEERSEVEMRLHARTKRLDKYACTGVGMGLGGSAGLRQTHPVDHASSVQLVCTTSCSHLVAPPSSVRRRVGVTTAAVCWLLKEADRARQGNSSDYGQQRCLPWHWKPQHHQRNRTSPVGEGEGCECANHTRENLSNSG